MNTDINILSEHFSTKKDFIKECVEETSKKTDYDRNKVVKIVMDSIKEKDTTKEELLKELEKELKFYLRKVKLIDSQKEDACNLIQEQLKTVGMALVEHPHTNYVKTLTGKAMAKNFKHLSKETKEDLRKGDFDSFSEEWMKKPVLETQIMFKGNGMANLPPVRNKEKYKHPITDTIHSNNSLNATNNIWLWKHLVEMNPDIKPSCWGKKNKSDRVQVSEDGIKILNYKKYIPTAIHYDGQLGQTEDFEARRIQIVYTADEGPIKLFCVPGSNTPKVRNIIQKITKTKGKPGFITLKSEFDKNPELKNLLYRYGVTLPKSGLLMFKANVWHFEGSGKPLKNGIIRNTFTDIKKLAPLTKKSKIFRIYCGVVSVSPSLVKDLIVLAYLRLNGWSMDVYTKQNRKHPLFVNEKSTRYLKVYIEPPGFDKLKNASLRKMKKFLSKYDSETLSLFGLKKKDLEY